MTEYDSLGALIRDRRRALGLSQEQLAERLSANGDVVRQAEISRIEQGRVQLPGRSRLERIAAALDLPLGAMLAQSGWTGADTFVFQIRTPGDDQLVLPDSGGSASSGTASTIVETVSARTMSDAEQAERARPHVFAVNNSSVFLDLVRQMLEDRYVVTTVSDNPRVFEQITAAQPDVVVVDLLPGYQGGWLLLEQLRHGEQTRHIPVIISSTSLALLDEAVLNDDQYGGKIFLAKPFDISKLDSAVELLIRGDASV